VDKVGDWPRNPRLPSTTMPTRIEQPTSRWIRNHDGFCRSKLLKKAPGSLDHFAQWMGSRLRPSIENRIIEFARQELAIRRKSQIFTPKFTGL
jgi:hypothetical protein